MCSHVYICLCGGHGLMSGIFLYYPLHLIFCFWLDWLATKIRSSSGFQFLALSLLISASMSALYMNIGLCACIMSTLATKSLLFISHMFGNVFLFKMYLMLTALSVIVSIVKCPLTLAFSFQSLQLCSLMTNKTRLIILYFFVIVFQICKYIMTLKIVALHLEWNITDEVNSKNPLKGWWYNSVV